MSAAESALRKPTSSGGERLSAWLTLARISNSPTVVSNVLVGAAIAGATQIDGTIAALAVAMVAFYTAGMFLNDVCDYSWDLQHRPDRPLVVGVVTRPAVLTATVVLFAVGLGLLWWVNPAAFIAGLVLIGFIVLYDTWHKTNALSPLVMAACRVMVYVAAFAAFAWPPVTLLYVASLALVVYMVGLTALAKSGKVRGPVIARLIAGISLLDALFLIVAGAGIAMIVIAVLAFALTLFFQRYVEGT